MAFVIGPGIDWASAGTARVPGDVSGDACIVAPYAGGVLAGLVDAIGHGPEAAEVARRAQQVLERDPAESPGRLLARCDEELRGSRGAVISLGSIRHDPPRITWAGVGNVSALLLRFVGRGREDQMLIAASGVLGSFSPVAVERSVDLRPGDLLIMATDGLDMGFAEHVDRKMPPRPIADGILAQHATGRDDALVLVARLRPPSP
ncbi:MAG TPA: SpoIIE family protein phosphatase [Candidatus Sulfotelmatobacter sp.]|jgi:hypothetical protein|nr:SpoIIE family protein phosphatase [Candidatus Sulfotelmatobacter sp.]